MTWITVFEGPSWSIKDEGARHIAGEIDSQRLADFIAAAPMLVATLAEAEAMFRWYGDLHAAKPDAGDKAKRNYDMADKCRAAIAAAEGE